MGQECNPKEAEILFERRALKEQYQDRWNGDTLKNLLEKAGLTVLKLQQDRTNMFPNILRLTPVINRVLLKIFTGPNELVALCSK